MIGQTISHYKILEKLGEGGMGVVYKAQDTKLDRFVALKFLPAHLAASEQDKARFIQEAKSASALNHPNVCTIHDISEHEGQLFIVMEFVDGKSLKEKKENLSQKQILEIGIQTAEGLAAAHEKGIVHRDIKPDNIMVRKDGIVQIMDFGLAKLYTSGQISRLTVAGTTMGTMGYMSPEQVQGLDVDHRTDIFSLGVVLYELLAGESPFKGVHETAIMYEIVNVDAAPLSTIKPGISPEIDTVILECLEKDPSERIQSAAEISRNLRRIKRESGKTSVSRTSIASRSLHSRSRETVVDSEKPYRSTGISWITLAVALVVVALIASFITSIMRPEPKQEVRKFLLSMDCQQAIVSPDGKKIAYYNGNKIWIRFLDKIEPVEIKSAGTIFNIFWAPSSDYVAYFTTGESDKHQIMKVSTSGVGTVLITQTGDNCYPRFWGLDDSIVVNTWDNTGNMLWKVPSSGGNLKLMYGGDTALCHVNGNLSHVFGLPDGKSIVISINYNNGKNKLLLQTNGKRKVLYTTSQEYFIGEGSYSSTGYIVFPVFDLNGSDIWALPFDASSLETTGKAFLVTRGGDIPRVSDNGLLSYVENKNNSSRHEQFVMLSRSGQIVHQFNVAQSGIYTPALSKDGSKIAYTALSGNNAADIWIYDIMKDTKTQLSYNIPQAWGPTWAPDGKSIVFANGFNGKSDLYKQVIHSNSSAEPFLKTKYSEQSPFWSLDGKYIVFAREDSVGVQNTDLWYYQVNTRQEPRKIFASEYAEDMPVLSPDNKYIAFQSNKSGQNEIWVTNFPAADHLWQVSHNGGNYPQWVRNEIFFVDARSNRLLSVEVKPGPEFGAPRIAVDGDSARYLIINDPNSYRSRVTNDGKNIIALQIDKNSGSKSNVVIVENWTEEFKNKK